MMCCRWRAVTGYPAGRAGQMKQLLGFPSLCRMERAGGSVNIHESSTSIDNKTLLPVYKQIKENREKPPSFLTNDVFMFFMSPPHHSLAQQPPAQRKMGTFHVSSPWERKSGAYF